MAAGAAYRTHGKAWAVYCRDLALSMWRSSRDDVRLGYAIAASRSFTETTFEQPGSSMVMP